MDDATDTVELGNREHPDESVPVYTFEETMQPPSSFVDQLLSNHLSDLIDLGVDADEALQTDDGADATTLLSHYHETTTELDSDDEDVDVDGFELSHTSIPIVLPRRRYTGACNVETIKDGKFLTYIYLINIIFSQ